MEGNYGNIVIIGTVIFVIGVMLVWGWAMEKAAQRASKIFWASYRESERISEAESEPEDD